MNNKKVWIGSILTIVTMLCCGCGGDDKITEVFFVAPETQ